MNNPNVLPGPNILAEDIEREIKKLKRAINRKLDPEPDLAPLVDNFPGVDNVGLLDTITAPLVMAATNTAPLVMVEMASQKSRIHRNTSQMRALAARQREFNRLGYAHIKDFYAGNITAEDLHARLRDEIKGLHVSAAVTGRGFEWDEMTFSDWGRVGNECRKQYGFLEGFVRKLADGGKPSAPCPAPHRRSS